MTAGSTTYSMRRKIMVFHDPVPRAGFGGHVHMLDGGSGGEQKAIMFGKPRDIDCRIVQTTR